MKNKTKTSKQPDTVTNDSGVNEVTQNEKPDNVEATDKT